VRHAIRTLLLAAALGCSSEAAPPVVVRLAPGALAAGLESGAPVAYAGVLAGTVEAVAPEGDRVRLTVRPGRGAGS
jgi:ABC-type transporter Mla subunit MlaD